MFRRLIKGLTDIIYPRVCLACKEKLGGNAPHNLVCTKCWANIKRNLPPFCHSCGRRLDKKSFYKFICPSCQKARLHFDRAFSPCVYDGAVKELIHEFKYKGKDYLGAPLSSLMIDFIKEYNLPIGYIDSIIPIPLHNARLREREFNQAEVLSNHIAREFNKSVLTNVLARHKNTKTQTDLEVSDRLDNVKNSFSVMKKEFIKGKNILLIDDVLTTGATSSEAALALKDSGANIVFVLTIAN